MADDELGKSKDTYVVDKDSSSIPQTDSNVVTPSNSRSAEMYKATKTKSSVGAAKSELDKTIQRLSSMLAPKTLTPDAKEIKRTRDLSGRVYGEKVNSLMAKNLDIIKNSLKGQESKLAQNKERMDALKTIRRDENETRMYGSLLRTETFNKNITSVFYRKSLEYQLSHLNTSKATLLNITKGFNKMESILALIVKNTGLPDYVKMKATEHVKAEAKGRLAGKIVDVVGSDEVTGKIKEKVESKSGGFKLKGIGNMNAILLALATSQLGKTKKGKEILEEIADLTSNPSAGLRKSSTSIGTDTKMKRFMGGSLQGIANLLDTDSYSKTIGSTASSKLGSNGTLTKKDIIAQTEEVPRLLSRILSEVTMIRKGDGKPVDDLRYDFAKRELVSTKSLNSKAMNLEKSLYSSSGQFVEDVNGLARMIANKSGMVYSKKDIMEIRAGLVNYMINTSAFNPNKLDNEFYFYFTPKTSDIVRMGIAVITSEGPESIANLKKSYFSSRMNIPDIDSLVDRQITEGNLDSLKATGLVKVGSKGDLFIDRDRMKDALLSGEVSGTSTNDEMSALPLVPTGKTTKLDVKDRTSVLDTYKQKGLNGLMNVKNSIPTGKIKDGINRVVDSVDLSSISRDGIISNIKDMKADAVNRISNSKDKAATIIKSTVDSLLEKLDIKDYITENLNYKDIMSVWVLSEETPKNSKELKTKILIYLHEAGKVTDSALKDSMVAMNNIVSGTNEKVNKAVGLANAEVILDVLNSRKNNKDLESDIANAEEKVIAREDKRVESIVSNVLEKLGNVKGKKRADDKDGDGVRDGSWMSNKERAKSTAIGIGSKIKDKVANTKGPLGMIFKLLGFAVPIILKYFKGVFDASKAIFSVVKPLASIIMSVGKGIISGIGGLFSVVKGAFGFGKNIFKGGKNILKGGKKLLGGGLTMAKKAFSSGMMKTVGKSLLKKIPGIGLIAGVGFGLNELRKGNFGLAAGELASGLASTIPGVGTALSVGIDGYMAKKRMDSEETVSEETDATTNETESVDEENKKFVEDAEEMEQGEVKETPEEIKDKEIPEEMKSEKTPAPAKVNEEVKATPPPSKETPEAKRERQKKTLERMRNMYLKDMDRLKNKPNATKRRITTVMLDAIENKLKAVEAGEDVEDFSGVRYDSATGRAVFYKSSNLAAKTEAVVLPKKNTNNNIVPDNVVAREEKALSDLDNKPPVKTPSADVKEDTSATDTAETTNTTSSGITVADKALYKETGKLASLSSIDAKLVAHIRKSETGTSSGNYSLAKDIGDNAGISFGAYQFTEKSGNLKEYVKRLVALTNDPNGKVILNRFVGVWYSGDKKELIKFLNDTGGTVSGRYVQDSMYREMFLDPAKNLAMKYGVTDMASVAHVVDHYLNAGPGGAKRLLHMAAGDYTPDNIAKLRKQFYVGLVRRNPNRAKFQKGWLNRVDSLSKEFMGDVGTRVDYASKTEETTTDGKTEDTVAVKTVNDKIMDKANKLEDKSETNKTVNVASPNVPTKDTSINNKGFTPAPPQPAATAASYSGLETLMKETNNSLSKIDRNTLSMVKGQQDTLVSLNSILSVLQANSGVKPADTKPKTETKTKPPRTDLPTGIDLSRGTTIK